MVTGYPLSFDGLIKKKTYLILRHVSKLYSERFKSFLKLKEINSPVNMTFSYFIFKIR